MVNTFSTGSSSNAWQVFLLFALPVGGGIPAGVLLAQKTRFGWLTMSGIYFISERLYLNLLCCFSQQPANVMHF